MSVMEKGLCGFKYSPAVRAGLTIGLLVVLILQAGCSINRMAVKRTGQIIEKGLAALYEETDLEVAETSLVANLKLIEVLLKNDPDNSSLLLLLAQGYYAYALGFVEDEDPERARSFYRKGRDYAFKALTANKIAHDLIDQPLTEMQINLKKLDEAHLAPLFWSAANWGNWIMLNLDDPAAIIELPRVEAMMNRVLELNETFFFAGCHLFFGSLQAARPPMFGGSPEQSRRHFLRAQALTNHVFLMINVYYARFYAVRVLDEALFEQLLRDVLKADLSILPEYALINRIAQKKAEFLLKKKEEMF